MRNGAFSKIRTQNFGMAAFALELTHAFLNKGRGNDNVSIFQARILLATDGSPHAEAAARTAVELAEATGSKLHVVAVGRSFPSGVYEGYTEK